MTITTTRFRVCGCLLLLTFTAPAFTSVHALSKTFIADELRSVAGSPGKLTLLLTSKMQTEDQLTTLRKLDTDLSSLVFRRGLTATRTLSSVFRKKSS